MRSLIKATLRDAGYGEIDEAIDGAAALRRIAEAHYDLIICDWDMPKATGLDVLQRVRSADQRADLPFIMLTGTTRADLVQQAIAAGVTDYLAKPFRPDALIEKVTRALS
jgi:CheY-like chemotaxis protein